MWPIAAAAVIALMFVFAFWRLATEPQHVDTSNYRFRPFATEEYAEQSPVWSPDGKSIAYAARPKTEWELTVKGVDGSAPAVVARSPQMISQISWTPDGSRLYYIGARTATGAGKLLSVARAGGEPALVIEKDVHSAALSPDSRTLATVVIQEDANGLRQKVLTLSSPPGSKGKTASIFPGGLTPDTMAWSPDGSKILLSIRGDGNRILGNDLFLFNVGAGQLRKLGNVPSVIFVNPAWLRDNRRVIVAWPEDDSADRNNLWVLDTETGQRSPVLPDVESVNGPSVSPDGTVAYTSSPFDYDLVELPLDGSPACQTASSDEAV